MSSAPSWTLLSYLWYWDFCTAATVLGDRHSYEAHLCNAQLVRSSGGTPDVLQLHRATAASQKWVLEHFSDSPFKRQNLRLRSVGTELSNTKKMVI